MWHLKTWQVRSTNDFDLDDFVTEQQEGLNFLQRHVCLVDIDIEPSKFQLWSKSQTLMPVFQTRNHT